jgi:hypothetical protein
LDIFEEAVGVVEPDLRGSVEGSEKYARRGIGYDPRLDVAANGFLDDGLAGEERPMSMISPVGSVANLAGGGIPGIWTPVG